MPSPSGCTSTNRHSSFAAPGSTRTRLPIAGAGPVRRNPIIVSPVSTAASVVAAPSARSHVSSPEYAASGDQTGSSTSG
jgi:hypothetical protein